LLVPRVRLPLLYEHLFYALSSWNGMTDGIHDERVPHLVLGSSFDHAPYGEVEHHHLHRPLENKTGRIVRRRCSNEWDACERTIPTIHEDD
jgi:hypothetical protein